MRARSVTRLLAAARLACAIAFGLVVVASVRSLRGDAPLIVDAAAPASRVDAAVPAAPRTDLSRLLARDPFSPLRAAPEVAYRIEGVTAEPAAIVVTRSVRLLGTVVRATGRSFAMCQVGSEPARLVYPGQRIGGMTLERVSPGSALFIDDAGARTVVRVSRTGG